MKSLEEGSSVVWVLKSIMKRKSLYLAIVAVVCCLGDLNSSCKQFPDDILLAIIPAATISCKGENAVEFTLLLLGIMDHLMQFAVGQVAHLQISHVVLGHLDLVGLGGCLCCFGHHLGLHRGSRQNVVGETHSSGLDLFSVGTRK